MGGVFHADRYLARGSDLPKFEQIEAESFDLGDNPEHGGLILEHAGEDSLTVFIWGTIDGKADKAFGPSRPVMRIVYKPGDVITCTSLTLAE